MSYVYYHATIEKVIDGDTVAISIDMGNRITWKENFRLAGIDTPEKGQEGYEQASNALKRLCLMPVSYVETFKPDKFGRWLVNLWLDIDGEELLANVKMIEDGHAVAYFGGKK